MANPQIDIESLANVIRDRDVNPTSVRLLIRKKIKEKVVICGKTGQADS